MDAKETAPEEVGRELRSNLLNSTAAEAGIEATPEFPHIWGVLMDWPVSEAVATVVGLADGHASLYTTSTFGVIGGGHHESVRAAAKRLVKSAEAHLEESRPAGQFPYPEPGQIHFYLLTYEGVRGLVADARKVEAGVDRLANLFTEGQELLTELRHVQQDDDGGGGDGQNEKEWFGIAGYLNCLLTGMSRGIRSPVEVVASRPIPNLEQLSEGNPALHDWIRVQEFDYAELAPSELIRLVRDSAGIRGLPFMSHKGEIPTMHAQPDGTVRARVFDVVIASRDKSMTITMAPDDDPRVIGLQAAADERAAAGG